MKFDRICIAEDVYETHNISCPQWKHTLSDQGLCELELRDLLLVN
jgi:hypothetical protein